MSRTYILVIIYFIVICDVRGQGKTPTISPYPVASVEKGQSLTLTCDYTGEDITILNIKRNGINIGIIRVLDTNPCSIYLANTTLYNVECLTVSKFRATILNVSEDENNLTWHCEVRVNGSYVPGNGTRIQVIVGITSVSLVSPPGNSVSVVENKTQQFQCATSAGNPKATVEWYKNKVTPNSLVDDSLITTGNTTETSPSGTLLVTIGKLTLAVKKDDNGLGVYCRANNGGNWQYSSRSVNLDVQFAPTNGPVIQDVTSPYYMIRGSSTTQQLTCTVTGGNPLATLTWSCYGSSSTGNVQDETVTSTVTWMAGSNDDSTCTCTGSNVVGWNRSTTVEVRVLYAPSAPQCSVGSSTVFSGKLKIIRGSTLTIDCSSVGNPLPDFTWTLPNGGTRPEPELTVNNVQTTATFALNVTNTMRPSIGQPQLGSNNTSFSTEILFPPVVNRFDNMIVLEGTTVMINCTTTPGNPPDTTIKWTRNQTQVASQQQLRIEKVTRQQSGVYTCSAYNVMIPSGCDSKTEPDQKDVYLDVQYPSEVIDANVVNFEGKATVTINESLTVPFSIICNVDGNPKSYIKLLRNGDVIQEAPHMSSLLFTQPNSNCERDMAVYTCTGSNKHNAQVSLKNLTLFVQCKPRPERNFSLDANITTSTGVNTTLTFKVAAYPRPTVRDFIWEKLEQNGSWTQLSNSSSVYYVVLKNNLTTHLTIKDVAESDFSSYRVNVSNTLGTTSHNFYLQAEEKPHPPSDLKYKLVEYVNHVILNWTPGFDGGLPQNFTIEYKIGSTTRWLQEQVGVGTYNHTLTRLDYGKQYDARVSAENSKGSSNYSNLIKFVTASKEEPPTNLGVVVGAPVGGLGIAALIIVVVVLGIRFRRKQSKSDAENMSLTTRNKQKTHSINTDEDMDDDLPDEIENPMYVGGETVQKTAADSSCIYSQPQKTKAQGTGDIYAVVQKKDKKKKPKAATKAEKKNEDIYENADKGTFDNKAFASAATKETNGTKPNKKLVNKDGLVYADIVFPNPPKGQKRFNIIGIDDMTEYAVVDLTKKADPLPESDDETSHETGK